MWLSVGPQNGAHVLHKLPRDFLGIENLLTSPEFMEKIYCVLESIGIEGKTLSNKILIDVK